MRALTLFIFSLSLFISTLESHALEPSAPAPDFELLDLDGHPVRLSQYKDHIVVLEWFNAGCPFVMKHYRQGNMQALRKELQDRGIVWLTINSTNAGHRDFLDPAAARNFFAKHGMQHVSYLADPSGQVGKLYGAKTTPYIVVVDSTGAVAYAGAIDSDSDLESDARKATNYVRLAVESLLAEKPVQTAKTNSYGCSIKYAG